MPWWSSAISSFNTTLVQLKGLTWGAVNSSRDCFNTTLVQLKGEGDYQSKVLAFDVSIPHWSN